MLIRSLVLAVVAGFAGPAAAAPACHPISPERIAKMWEHYRQMPGAEPNSKDALYECMANGRMSHVFCRTRPANPAHPSFVVRTVQVKDGQYVVVTEADTAAECGPFLEMMRQFNELTSNIR